MRYPSTLQYAESVQNPDGLFQRLSGLCVSGPGDFSSGAYGVVFKVQIDGKSCALKCFTRHQPGRIEAYRRIASTLAAIDSPYLVGFQWLDDEITVFGDDDTPSLHSVVLMEWAGGESLTRAIAAAVHGTDPRAALRQLSRAFDRLARWLLGQSFAHGDLKPDNIMVREGGQGDDGKELALIDYDGLYLPDMHGELARENGTEGFRHPGRSEAAFGKQIDDYPIALISLSLRALAEDPGLYDRFGSPDTLLFQPGGIASGQCPAYEYLKGTPLADDPLFSLLASPHERLDNLAEALSGHTLPMPSGDYDYIGPPSVPDGIRLVRRGGRYGYIIGKRAMTPIIYDKAREFADGAAAVCRNEKWGYIGTDGKPVTEAIYDDCGDFSEGLAPVCIGGKWGYIAPIGAIVVRCRFDDAWPFAEGKGLVRRKGKYGFIGPDDRMKIPARYDFAQSFREGVACVMLDGRYGYIGPNGRFLIRPMFDYARTKRNGRAYVEMEGKGREIEL